MFCVITEFYSYLFQEEEQVTAAYFSTRTGTEYRIYFYPASEYFDALPGDSLLNKNGYFFGFTKLAPNEDKNEAFDPRIRNTILQIVSDFFEEVAGADKVLIFHCDDADGRKAKRSKSFGDWYESSDTSSCFLKIDETIVLLDEHGKVVDEDYLSLIIQCDNLEKEQIVKEFQSLKESLIANKQ